MDNFKIIGVSGKAFSGKDTFCNTFKDIALNTFRKNYHIMAFADSLKEKLMAEFDLSEEQLYGNLKEVPDKRYPKKVNDVLEYGKIMTDKDFYWTPREIMQFIGTDCYRAVCDNFWIKALHSKILNSMESYDGVLVTDCRFINELKLIKSLDGVCINIHRDNYKCSIANSHISENDFNKFNNFDFVINNDYSIDKFKEKSLEVINLILGG